MIQRRIGMESAKKVHILFMSQLQKARLPDGRDLEDKK
jgi:hypothetical protein